jgi:chemotaxis protein methyltransferase CheR
MKVDPIPHIGKTEINRLVKSVRTITGADLSVLTPATLQLLFSTFIHDHGYGDTDMLIRRLEEDPGVVDDLHRHFDIPDTEMFRDPDIWRYLFTVILPGLLETAGQVNAWFPSCSSGDDVYSLVILSREQELNDRIRIDATSTSSHRLSEVRTGTMSREPLDLSAENYREAGGSGHLMDYIDIIDRRHVRKSSLVKDVRFDRQGLLPGKPPRQYDLIMYRNRLNRLEPGTRSEVIGSLLGSLVSGGALVIGYSERITGISLMMQVNQPDVQFPVYQKK